MKEYLHLFTPASEVESEKSYYLCFYVDDRGYNFVSESKVQQYEGVFYDYDGKTITHVLDLSKLTTKELVNEAVDKYCSDLEINTAVIIDAYFNKL